MRFPEYEAPQLPEKILGKTSRAHVAIYRGGVRTSTWRPIVLQMVDIHGQEAEELVDELKINGREATILEEGDPYLVKNPEERLPKGIDRVLNKIHKHPEGLA